MNLNTLGMITIGSGATRLEDLVCFIYMMIIWQKHCFLIYRGKLQSNIIK